MSAPREAILARIRAALQDVPSGEAPGDVPVARAYRVSDASLPDERIYQLLERVAEYRARVHRVAPADLPAAIASALSARGVKTLAVPADLPPEWLPPGVEPLRDPGLTHEQLDSVDGVLTGCAMAIAQTGTIVLDGGPAQGRRALTLLPDYHLCVVLPDQVVGLVPEAIARLEDAANRPMTWVSGPSATSDIELNRVEGVHGPRHLEVIVVASDEPRSPGPRATQVASAGVST